MAKKKTPSHPSSDDPVTAYALDVTQGKVVAGPDIRAACARHLQDLDNGPQRGLTWDLPAAMRVIEYFRRVLKLNGGEFENLPFELLPWQAFVVGSLFGWKNESGYRRFRQAYVEAGKGSGKSPLAAGIGLYCMTADNEPRAEIYAAATKKDQAMVLFRDAVAMVDQSAGLSAHIKKSGIGDLVWNLAFPRTGSFFRPISADEGGSGPRPHVSLIDEVHEHKNNRVVELLRAGTKGRRQALILMITNSGSDRTSVCFDYHEYGRKVASGQLEDDSFFSFICSLDEGDDPFVSEECWAKANPSLGHTIDHSYLRDQVTQARGMPSKEATVRRLNFCQWVEGANPWLSYEIWDGCEREFDISDLYGEECVAGLDLSGTRDLTALALYFPRLKKAFVEFWTPADTLLERAKVDRVPYEAWVKAGFLHTTPGHAVRYEYVAARLGELAGHFNIQQVAFDPYRIKYFSQELDEQGIELVLTPHGQGYMQSQQSGLWMPRSIELFEELLTTQGIEILKNPCLRWNASAAVLEADQKDNRIFAKKKATGRIDGVVALAMAVGIAQQDAPDDSGDLEGFLSNPIILG